MKTAPTSTNVEPCLVADIGGTNARFALGLPDADFTKAELSMRQTRRVADFATLADALADYLTTLPVRPRRAVLAVACPVTGDEIDFTNNAWRFSMDQLRHDFLLESLQVINDFAAVATAATALDEDDLVAIGNPAPEPAAGGGGTRLVLGTGTGLGVAALLQFGQQPVVLPSEGGHIGFSPQDAIEDDLLAYLRARHQRVSAERLLSGEGLLAIHQALSQREKEPTRFTSAAEITRAAGAGDAVAITSTRTFCAILGSFAGDAALMFNAWSGVYLAGDMLAHLFAGGGADRFRERFADKGRFAGLTGTVPTWRISRNDIGELGAAIHDAWSLRGQTEQRRHCLTHPA